MVSMTDYEGFDLSLLADKDTMMSKFGAIGKVGRYAVVGAPKWMGTLVTAMGPLMPLEMRTFDKPEETAARDWVVKG